MAYIASHSCALTHLRTLTHALKHTGINCWHKLYMFAQKRICAYKDAHILQKRFFSRKAIRSQRVCIYSVVCVYVCVWVYGV